MLVSDLGEFGLIDCITRLIDKKSIKRAGPWQDLLVPAGDDAAAWKSRNGIELITTDILVEDIHFDFSYTSWQDLGWKSIAINISDIYAMGGRPQYALVSLALPGAHLVSDVLAMYEGIIKICNKYGIVLAGGNISASEKVVVNVTLTGMAGKDIMTRSAARPGDLIAVFGHPGLSTAGWKALIGHKKIDEADMKIMRRAHVHPAPALGWQPAE
jgi:thiamine-monophosphate kinase